MTKFISFQETGRKLRTFILTVTIMFVLGCSAIAGTKEDGKAAYKNKDFDTALRLLEPFAESGEKDAQVIVANIYFEREDEAAMIKWYTVLAEQGDPSYQYVLGLVHSSRINTPPNFPMAIKWLTAAAEQEFEDARTKLNIVQLESEVYQAENLLQNIILIFAAFSLTGSIIFLILPVQRVLKNYVSGAVAGMIIALPAVTVSDEFISFLFKRGLPLKDWQADIIGILLFSVIAIIFWKFLQKFFYSWNWEDNFNQGITAWNSEDFEKAFRIFEPIAKSGDSEAQVLVGVMLFEGRGTEQNIPASINFLKKSADQNKSEAYTYLGKVYLTSEPPNKNEAEAFQWFKKAAEIGDEEAQYYLGLIYYEGRGIVNDSLEAFKWISAAAELGNAKAQCFLAMLYHEGLGIPKNYKEAKKWYTLAANQLDVDAQTNLGAMYWLGEGIEQDRSEAERLFELAARQGDIIGQQNLELIRQDIPSEEYQNALKEQLAHLRHLTPQTSAKVIQFPKRN